MYYSLRRAGSKLANARARQLPAECHDGTYRDFLRRHEWECAKVTGGKEKNRKGFCARLLDRVADSRNLRCAIDSLARKGGQAPGPNGRTLREYSDHECWKLARVLSSVLWAETYSPGPERRCQIPKGNGRGYRTLCIQSIEDRVVQRAILQIIQPYLDPMFLDCSLGFRPGRGRGHALALAEKLAREQGRWVWITEDIKDAFDQVPRERLLDAVRRDLPDKQLVALIKTVIHRRAKRGLRQGGNLSPLLLNLYLHHVLDRPWSKRRPAAPLIRVADDLLVLCRDINEAEAAYGSLRDVLKSAGMPLKGKPATTIHDLTQGDHAEWLGFVCRWNGQDMTIRPGEKCWHSLDESLGLAHSDPGSPIRAHETIVGWLSQLGPCNALESIEEVYERIVRLALAHAFDELMTLEEAHAVWRQARARWTQLRERVGIDGSPTISERRGDFVAVDHMGDMPVGEVENTPPID